MKDHRQPRAGDVPNEKTLADPNNPLGKEGAALDRKIRSICSGCQPRQDVQAGAARAIAPGSTSHGGFIPV